MEVFDTTKGVILSTIIMTVTILFLNYFLSISLLFSFIIKIFVGIVGYAFSLLVFEKVWITSLLQKGIKLISKK